jgi:hypothetical protein
MKGSREVLDVAGSGMASTGRHCKHPWQHPLDPGPVGRGQGSVALASAVVRGGRMNGMGTVGRLHGAVAAATLEG